MKPVEGDPHFDFVMSSGRRVYANGAIIGIYPEMHADCLDVPYGYDGGIMMSGYGTGEIEQTPWTREEKIELAGYLIEQWTKWRDAQ